MKRVYWVGVVDWAIRRFHGFELSTHRGTSYNAYLIVDREIQQLIAGEVGGLVNPKRGFKLFERIHRIKLIENPFEPGVEMTHSLKLKRDVINELYEKEIAELFRDR